MHSDSAHGYPLCPPIKHLLPGEELTMPFNMMFSAGGCQSQQVHEFYGYAETR